MLAAGQPLLWVLQSVFGTDSAGRAWLHRFWQVLEPLPTEHLRRQVTGHFLRMWSLAGLHGSQWRVIAPAAFVGHEHEYQEIVDEFGEFMAKRVYVPKSRAGGMAAREKRSPRTLHRYRRVLRGGAGGEAIMRSEQPPQSADDAVLPRQEGSCWAYAQHWLLLRPSPEMIRRWTGKGPTRPAAHAQRDPHGPEALEELRTTLADLRER